MKLQILSFFLLLSAPAYAQDGQAILQNRIELINSFQNGVSGVEFDRIPTKSFVLDGKRSAKLNLSDPVSIAIHNLSRLGVVTTWNQAGTKLTVWLSVRSQNKKLGFHGQRWAEFDAAREALALAKQLTTTNENQSIPASAKVLGSTYWRVGGHLTEADLRHHVEALIQQQRDRLEKDEEYQARAAEYRLKYVYPVKEHMAWHRAQLKSQGKSESLCNGHCPR